MSGYHLSAFDVGQVKAHMHHGLSAAAISRIMRKSDGLSQWDEKSIQRVVDKLVPWHRSAGDHNKGCEGLCKKDDSPASDGMNNRAF